MILRLFICILFGWSCSFTFSQNGHTLTLPEDLYNKYSWEAFSQLAQANDTIDPSNINYELLDAAVFLATNKVRLSHNLPPLVFSPALRSMASYHAQQMAKHRFVSHENYFAIGYSTMDIRSKRFLADAGGENVADMFLYDYESTTRYYRLENDTEAAFFYSHNDQQLFLHTYLSFAIAMVEAWMGSPAHRDNILDRDFKSLGCAMRAHLLDHSTPELPKAYAVQNFGY